MTDTKYWEDYYNTHLSIEGPSPFAKYVLSEFEPYGKLIELGCGTGRDAVHFATNKLDHVTGVDQCPNVVKRLNNLKIPNATFVQSDFTRLTNRTKFDHIYSRFTLHSVERVEASRTLKWSFQALNRGGRLYIEVRSVHDELFGIGDDLGDDAWFTDHYRRFIRINELSEELKTIGFNLLYEVESKGFAPYKDEDPAVIRIVAEKK